MAVVYLIGSAGLRMLRAMEKTLLSCVLCGACGVALIALTLTATDFSSVFLILAGGGIGVLVWLVGCARRKGGKA